MARYKYPYSDFHELNLDYILKLCRESLGIGLKVVDKELYLVNDLDEPLSKVTISYADTALHDNDGNEITAYILDAGIDNKKLVFTHGNDEITAITVPYATQASEDDNGNRIDSYVKRVGVAGDKLLIVFGDQSTFSFNCPYAVKASTDVNGKDLVTYAAGIEVDGNEIVLTDGRDLEITRITVQYAEKANKDLDGDPIKSNYAHSLTTGTTTVKLIAKDGTELSEITVPYATTALTDTNGNAFLSDYVEALVVDGQRIGVEAHDGTRLSTITVPFATLATDATNAVETVQVVGDQMVFTTFGGQSFTITCPYSVRALKDNLQNEITKTYVANVTNNTTTGEITFYDAEGQEIVSMIPVLDKAIHDSYNNLIADYVKQILVDSNSNYVTVVHGTGTSESLIINYATHAWKDTNDNVIKNFYVAYLECIEDVQDGHFKLVAYDGDTPRAELWRIELKAYMAQVDVNERAITSYVGEVTVNSDDDIEILDGEGNHLNSIAGAVSMTPSGTVQGTEVTLGTTTVEEVTSVGTLPSKAADTFVAPTFTYDATDESLTFDAGSFTEGAFNAGTLPTSASKTVADGTATVDDPIFIGDPEVANVEFSD